MGRIEAYLKGKLMFVAEAEHKLEKAHILFEDREGFPSLRASEKSSLLGVLSSAQRLANEAGVKLQFKQDGHIGGMVY
ncbi:MAG TPA: hypothetical protein DIT64_10195 [Verrucomicrobiales bacterium]|nr:hypothetical protein [Verrucomicrobiales bacterium]